MNNNLKINQMKSIVIAAFLMLGINVANAHALWIETKTIGKIGQAEEVKIYYGEYASNEREEVSKWYSDVKDFSLWLTAPGKEKIKLNTTAGANFFSAGFTPDKEGLYILTVSHEAKELAGTTKYTFSSVALVNVGKPTAIDQIKLPNTLKVAVSDAKIYKVNAPVQLKAMLDGKPWANKSVSVFTPEGWSKEFKTDEQGNIAFNPIWPGRYVLEVSNYEKKTGEHDGKAFDAAWQGATSSFEVTE
jgi:uncharacterized GH25 family protein